MKKIYKMLLFILFFIILALAAVLGFFFVGSPKKAEKITWGVDFSQMQSGTLGLDWKENYLAVLDDLGAKNIKLHTQWDFIEGSPGNCFFDDIDWQVNQAEQRNAKIIYVLGMKTGRWPECHMPAWTANMPKEQVQAEVLKYITEVVQRYKNSKAIDYWQVENEPLFRFGQCPDWYYSSFDFLKKEVALVKSLDPSRKIIISDSGEQSLWFQPAKIGDIVGITMYKKVWVHIVDGVGFNLDMLFNPIFYQRKAELIKKFFGKDVICIELQAEPWAEEPFYNLSLSEQEKTMNLKIFRDNVEFAEQTGLNTFYFWGVEWWYWLKEKQGRPEIWNQAKTLFNKN